jgi:hypothetical protein
MPFIMIQGRTVGRTEESQYSKMLFDNHGNLLARYDKKMDMTYGSHGNYLGNGDLTMTQLKTL